jgi:hypothetical protein
LAITLLLLKNLKHYETMRNTEGCEQTNYFSETTILDYIDGKLPAKEEALLEQKMLQDREFQLAVNGIRTFYLKEHQSRAYLENLLNQNEGSIREMIQHRAAVSGKTALYRRKQRLRAMAVAACVALMVAVTLPTLFRQVQTPPTVVQYQPQQNTTPLQKLPPATDAVLEQLPKAMKESEQAAETPMPSVGLRPKTNKLPKVTPKNKALVDQLNTSRLKDQPTTLPKARKRNRQTGAANSRGFAKRDKKSKNKDEQKNRHNYLLHRTASADPEKADDFVAMYRTPGKLHLWVFTDQTNATYQQLVATGKQIAQNTHLQLNLKTVHSNEFRYAQCQQLLKQTQPATNDVIWVHYLDTQPSGSNKTAQAEADVAAVANQLNNMLHHTPADFTMVMIDQGKAKQVPQSKKHYGILNGKQSVGTTAKMNASSNPQGYRQLFLGNSGNLTLYSHQQGRNAYRGVLTEALLQSMQGELRRQKAKIHWRTIVKKTEKMVKTKSKKMGRVQKIMKVKGKLKNRY